MSDIIARGLAAERLLRDETMKEAWAELQQDLMNEWAKSPESDEDKRERLFRNVVAIHRVQGMLAKFVQDGKMAAARDDRAAQSSRP